MIKYLNVMTYKIRATALITILIVFLIPSFMSAQMKGVTIGFGLSTLEILGNNVATLPFLYKTGEGADNVIFGGSFDGTQPGFRAQISVPIDANEVFEVPIGIDYHFLMGREKIIVGNNADIKLQHDVNIATITSGLNYNFFYFNPLNAIAKFYTGFELRATFIQEGEYRKIESYVQSPDKTTIYKSKDAAFRLGAAVHLGLNGELSHPWYVNTSVGLGVMNLLGKDDERGELLTRVKKTGSYTEVSETTVFNYHFSFMIQYKL